MIINMDCSKIACENVSHQSSQQGIPLCVRRNRSCILELQSPSLFIIERHLSVCVQRPPTNSLRRFYARIPGYRWLGPGGVGETSGSPRPAPMAHERRQSNARKLHAASSADIRKRLRGMFPAKRTRSYWLEKCCSSPKACSQVAMSDIRLKLILESQQVDRKTAPSG